MGVYWAEIADGNSTQRQIEFLKKAVEPEGYILDLACGTGRHMIALRKGGYDVVGLDVSRNLLGIAENRFGGNQLVRADMRRLPFKPEVFAAALSMDTSFGYLPAQQDDIHVLAELRSTLKQDGLLVIDVFNREQLTKKYESNPTFKMALLPSLLKLGSLGKQLLIRFYKWREYPSFYLLQRRTTDADGNRLRDIWVVRGKADGKIRVFRHAVRLYRREVLEKMLDDAGFTVKAVQGGYEGQPFGSGADRLILVAIAK